MGDKNSVLLDEAVTKIYSNLENDKIETKTWAEFAVVFYRKYKSNYNERLLVKIVKQTLEFYRRNLEISSKREQLKSIFELLKKIDENKNGIYSLYKLKELENKNFKEGKEEYNNEQFKEWEKELNGIKDKNFELKDKKFFFFSKKRKQKEAKVIIESLEKLSAQIKNSTEDIKIEVEEKDKDILRLFENINEDLKKFIFEVKNSIGVELAEIEYEEVIQNKDVVKDFVFNVIIQNLDFYFKNKNIA